MAATLASKDGPRRLGRYVLARELWTGAWFSVWSAVDTESGGSPAAVKRLHASLLGSDVARLRLLEAARSGALLSHPNVLETREVLEVDGEIAIGTEEIQGVPLREVLRAAASHGVSVPPPVAVRIALELLAALETAHSSSGDEAWPDPITPVDLTPENVLITAAGAIKLVDVTLERAAAGLVGPLASELMGYRAPERLDRAGDQRSDLFAVGVLLWEMLAEKPLFAGSNVAEAVRKRTIPRLDDAATRASGPLPNKLATVIARALTRATAGRFPSADSMGQALMASGAAVGSLEDVATLVTLVQRARAVAGSAARGPTTQVLRQEFLQTPLVGTVVSPLARQQPSPTPPAAKVGPIAPKPQASPAPPPTTTTPMFAKPQPAQAPATAKPQPAPAIAAIVPTPPPAPVRTLAVPTPDPALPTPPPRAAEPAGKPVGRVTLTRVGTPPPPLAAPAAPAAPAHALPPAPPVLARPGPPSPPPPSPGVHPPVVAPELPASAPSPAAFFFPAATPAAAAPPAPEPGALAPGQSAPATRLPSEPPADAVTRAPWWRRPLTLLGAAAFAALLWIVILAVPKKRASEPPAEAPAPRAETPAPRTTASAVPQVTPPPREDPPPVRVATEPAAPAPDPGAGGGMPPADGTVGPGGVAPARPTTSGDIVPAPAAPEPTKPAGPRRKYNPKTI